MCIFKLAQFEMAFVLAAKTALKRYPSSAKRYSDILPEHIVTNEQTASFSDISIISSEMYSYHKKGWIKEFGLLSTQNIKLKYQCP